MFLLNRAYSHSSDPPFFKRGGTLVTSPGILKKRGWKNGAGAGLLERGVGTFSIEIFQGLSFLHL